MSRPIVLYHPSGEEGHVLPLGLVHMGSMTPEDRVEIIDGRVELAPEARVVELGGEALCLVVSVQSRVAILDALRVSRAAKAKNPGLPVLWAGWHAALLPETSLASGAVDACVVGQGERTLEAVTRALRAGRPFEGLPGLVAMREGKAARNPPRPFEDVNGFPAADFGLLDLERYFRFRGARRLDYCASQGCPFECASCAVALTHETHWSGLAAERVVAEIKEHVGRYRLSEVFFTDSNFFTEIGRSEAIGRGLIEAGVRVHWFGTGRADQLSRLTDDQLRVLRASGCARVRVGAASGRLPEQTPKGTLVVEDVLQTAEKLHRAGIGARFSFITGFPEEPKAGLAETYRTAKAVREIDGAFETPIHFYSPYLTKGPRTLEEWGSPDLDHATGPWITEAVRRAVTRYNFYLRHGYERPGRRLGKRLLHYLARVRAKTNFYALDFERRAVDLSKRLRTGRNRPQPPGAEG